MNNVANSPGPAPLSRKPKKIPHPTAGLNGGKQVELCSADGKVVVAETRVVLRHNNLPDAERDRLLMLIAQTAGASTARYYERGKLHIIGQQPQTKN